MEKEKKEVDEKYIKAICINIVKAIIVIFYFLILNLISEKIGEELFRRGIQICTMIFLFIAIYIIEKAYKEDDGVKAIQIDSNFNLIHIHQQYHMYLQYTLF